MTESHGYPLRSRLLLLAVAGLAPLALMSGLGLFLLEQHHRAQTERLAADTARALSTAVDAELGRAISVLQTLASAAALETGDLAAFHAQARRVVQAQPGWLLITLASPEGAQLLNTRTAANAKLPDVVEPESLAEAVRQGVPLVGYLAQGAGGTYAVPVRLPVMTGGRLRYVLTAVVKPDAMMDVLNRQRVPDEWVISVLDARGTGVARSRAQAQALGSPAAPSLAELIARPGTEARGLTQTLEGHTVYTAVNRSPRTGWAVAVGIPETLLTEGAARTILAYAVGLMLSLAFSSLVVFFIARSIAVPMASLRAAARALGRREVPIVPLTQVSEIREVGDAIMAAGRERARIEAHREQLLRSEQQARSAAEQANRSKDEFLSMLSHELRNPIGAIANASRLLDRPDVDPAVAVRAREVILRQTRQLNRLSDDLLDAERIVSGRVALERRSIDLAAAARQALETPQSSQRTRSHRITTELADVWVEADPVRLEQIIVNLLDNALKFTPEGGSIHVAVRRESGFGVFSVQDDGIGMSPELTNRVFDLFAQGERGLHRPSGGLGIGLTIVRRLAELQGGKASAHSDGSGRGSTFEFRLPCTADAAPRSHGSPEPETAVQPRDVLVVEDHDDARMTLRLLLEASGHRVTVARDGVEGLAAIRSAPPDIALIDIGLPEMDGYALAQQIVTEASAAGRPFLVALTGYGLPADRARALAAGFDAHLVKPVDHTALKTIFERL